MAQWFTRENLQSLMKDLFYDLIASIFMAVSIQVYSAPNHIILGGVTGIATVFNFLFGLPIGTVSLIINIPLLLVGYKYVSKEFFISTIRVLVISAFATDVLFANVPSYEGNLLLAALFGGAFSGVGLGIVLKRGGSTGGTDIIVKIIKRKRPHLSFGNIIMATDLFILAFAGIVYRDIEVVMYALILITVATVIIDKVTVGSDARKLVIVVSKRNDEISRKIIEELDRSATLLDAKGAYTRDDTNVMMCVISKQEFFTLKKNVKRIDPTAFIIVADATEIIGEGFKAIDHEE